MFKEGYYRLGKPAVTKEGDDIKDGLKNMVFQKASAENPLRANIFTAEEDDAAKGVKKGRAQDPRESKVQAEGGSLVAGVFGPVEAARRAFSSGRGSGCHNNEMPRKATLGLACRIDLPRARPIEARAARCRRGWRRRACRRPRASAWSEGCSRGRMRALNRMLMTAFASAPDQVWGALGAQINADDAAWDDALAESRRLVRELGKSWFLRACRLSRLCRRRSSARVVADRGDRAELARVDTARQRASLEREASDLFARASGGRSEGLLRRSSRSMREALSGERRPSCCWDIAFARGRLEEAARAGGCGDAVAERGQARAIEEEKPASLAGLGDRWCWRVRAKQVLAAGVRERPGPGARG
ncbi:MAG: hypothetical protein U0793_08000 [Gemmataceae bacterium]